MSKKRERFLSHADHIDPEHRILRAAILAAICCLASIIIFQWLHQPALLGWAAFAALAYSQIDTLEVPSKRILYLLSNIAIFTALALIGITLGNYPVWFGFSIPIIIFVCGCTIAFGNRYFNPGAWAAFLYVAFGSSLGDRFFAWHVGLTFLGIGIICLIISLLFFPEKPPKRLQNSVIRILKSIYAKQAHTEELLILQNTLLQTYLQKIYFTEEQQTAYWELHKGLYQLYLLQQQIQALKQSAMQHVSFDHTQLADADIHIQKQINVLLKIFQKQPVSLQNITDIVSQYRINVQKIQIVECQKPNPDLKSILDYSNYLYHCIQIWNLLDSLIYPAKLIIGRKP